MPHSINSEVCEGISECVKACPVDCIKQASGTNKKGTTYYFIDFSTCIDCGVCLSVCPIKNAVVSEERPDLQQI
ncbi:MULTISPECIES: indolepyruvate ferredoxin oxidoreductase subunit alpha [Prochlorococcus]|uniref:Ferredoxin n=1 Tax=Prochlorococcus marinus (strain SARG / CCMP1375 / SS120) TaxID=167539 RepID=Q7VC07_PROMA|nr:MULTISPECIES: 4Fe-4S binding protein [Prochlorococcus]AAP99979.1 Ferredoxin [Prochlorococcus marinus subsp. marinus str. CCMP1375]KGG13777.1 Ferredoxin [Prochlorococcus marinus str. LG]KGG18912.1 Ferredoxin [Prochlorococcus marinus str. SS2]KGG23550.1 Ferredoxin [Prochlorococcus marinus str. SS35]KGG32214.1 Ferredoxin [Prochlorococcus marinus str. SS51]